MLKASGTTSRVAGTAPNHCDEHGATRREALVELLQQTEARVAKALDLSPYIFT